ncbi:MULTISPECIES: bifunctional phosphoribosyl-AMP cyclohydrolase/phosphoribosyl-ATP diphosphatase HisIE [Oceanobacillus]|uniref:Histidine biosynthesis bifunctional protein HisIE n=1 Tax=Oceanobacillus kimchii TaxID=746691 RepID=A0ABQ5TFH9_9BACI|nr:MULTISPECIES: bifunctional phosphoribosyl-AMP cyclohydrolase/phosphoribosyl-ATP diphosphatase HisIE [Oceanobacillus]MBT2652862.1 bifunctional phosphoribosyl-AMP cyclohydrolase/phosphoribosyl-ATP diphosphatase HisIE [Oceanobacillus sp. ISL-73]MCT1577406.1 bifunctional phosphoribosyl-AMP cyclohydrolase/phosphoribosyl-ATP diphosphatase HisIE [Oceanobacillus kimchii]MCT2137012.1 bifunctional phosphoribosyl-AMP cyclohydrolase/phosphoribosyl-ATP diphosphatase HisIE [Oceanobacillus kimchii]OEH53607
MTKTISIEKLQFDENGLIPAIVQEYRSGQVLTLAYMNSDSITKTIETNETWFYSRKRQELWNKGATSGNKQTVKQIYSDCDADALLVLVEAQGPACHTGEESCFYEDLYINNVALFQIIPQVTSKIKERHEHPVEGAYTSYLFEKGVDKILKKIGEEAAEVVIAAKNEDKQELTSELSDLLYHSLVLMEQQGVTLEDIKKELYKRHVEKEGQQRE